MTDGGLLALFVVGLLSGVHCIGMCGGLVAAIASQLPGTRPGWPYLLLLNAGRLTSYTMVGAVAGSLGGVSHLLADTLPLQQGLALLAHGVVILLGLHLAGLTHWILLLERPGQAIWRRLQPFFQRQLPIRSPTSAYMAGLFWGWLPCGLVYSAAITAMSSGSSLAGAASMLAFGLGTLANLLLAGFAARQVLQLLQQRRVRQGAGAVIVLLGLIGIQRTLAI